MNDTADTPASMEPLPAPRPLRLTSVAVGAAILVILLWGANLYVAIVTQGDLGTVGDTLGIASALFNGLAFVFLVVSIRMQSEELALQRQELAATRRELEAQRLIMEEQGLTARMQRFENTFFEMVKLRNTLVADALESFARGQDRTYDDLLEQALGTTRSEFQRGLPYSDSESRSEARRRAIQATVNEFDDLLDPSFALFRRIVELISKSPIHNKGFYGDVYAALMTPCELVLNYYRVADSSDERLRKAALASGVFTTLPRKILIDPDCDASLLAAIAEGRDAP